jgi:hypothetical protein
MGHGGVGWALPLPHISQLFCLPTQCTITDMEKKELTVWLREQVKLCERARKYHWKLADKSEVHFWRVCFLQGKVAGYREVLKKLKE